MTDDELAEEVAVLQRRIEALKSRRVIEVERIDVVEADGTARMVISNSARGPDPVCDGTAFKRDGGQQRGTHLLQRRERRMRRPRLWRQTC